MSDCEIVTLWRQKKAITLVFKSRKQIMLLILRLMYRLLSKPKEVGTFIRLYFEECSLLEISDSETFNDESIIRVGQEVVS